MPVVLLRGMRQIGKSSLLQKIAGETHTIAKFDYLEVRTLAQENPGLFLQQFPPPLIVDEAQYAPALFPEIKAWVDTQRELRLKDKVAKLHGLFLMTGSEQTEIKKQIQETLSGRIEEHILHPLSIHELLQSFPELNLNSLFLKGGWPELHVGPELRPYDYLNHFIDTFILKDIVKKQGVEKISSFTRALKLFAARSGHLLNRTEVANGADVKSVTIEDWLSLLNENFVISLLPSYSVNLSKRVVKTSKLYLNDVGLASRLQGWSDEQSLFLSPNFGHLYETMVFTEILRTRDHFNKRWNLFYWRTKQKEEVDFLIEDERGHFLALDAKVSGSAFEPRELLKHFSKMKNVYSVSLTGKKMKKTERCIQIPLCGLAEFLLENLS